MRGGGYAVPSAGMRGAEVNHGGFNSANRSNFNLTYHAPADGSEARRPAALICFGIECAHVSDRGKREP